MKGILKFFGCIAVSALLGFIIYQVVSRMGNTIEPYINMLLSVIVASVVCAILLAYIVLPPIAEFFSYLLYGNTGEEPEPLSAFDQGMIFKSQQEYYKAVDKFEEAIVEDPDSRLPWTEISTIYADFLQDPEKAVDILADALDAHEWIADDICEIMFRVAAIYRDYLHDKESAISVYEQIIETFPDSFPIQQKVRERLYALGVQV